MRKRQKESECEIERGRKGEQSDDIIDGKDKQTQKNRQTDRETKQRARMTKVGK